MRWGHERQGQQLTISGLSKAGPTIYGLRRAVVVTYFNSQRSDASLLAETPNLNQSGRTKAFIAMIWLYIEIIQASDRATVFHRVLESKHDMSNILMCCLDNPDVPQTVIGEDGCKCIGRTGTAKIIAGFSIELSHQVNQQGNVVGTRSSHCPGQRAPFAAL